MYKLTAIHTYMVLTDTNDNPNTIRPHFVFTDGRQQQQPNHYTKLQPHIVFTDGRQRQPNHNTTAYCVY